MIWEYVAERARYVSAGLCGAWAIVVSDVGCVPWELRLDGRVVERCKSVGACQRRALRDEVVREVHGAPDEAADALLAELAAARRQTTDAAKREAAA